ncbi:MAG TPA: 2TM domain-containing protein [Actinobacteria bacterium]|nr:2TM domain-containing protein [Actinomycetes bacterium]HEX21141.1 2TM domain-containing protein [Actinomycetota bacterium]
MDNQNNQSYKLAKKKAAAERGFYSHLISYVTINIVIIIINLLTSPDNLWFYWVTIFWGIGIFFHALDTFTIRNKTIGKEWEKKKSQQIEDEEQRKAG